MNIFLIKLYIKQLWSRVMDTVDKKLINEIQLNEIKFETKSYPTFVNVSKQLFTDIYQGY
jgi:hypothetical protein